MKYFSLDMNIESIESNYRLLALELHPDKSNYDSQDDFISMKLEYDEIKAIKKHWFILDGFFKYVYYRHPETIPELNIKEVLSKSLNFINDVSGTVKQVRNVAKNTNRVLRKI